MGVRGTIIIEYEIRDEHHSKEILPLESEEHGLWC